MVAPEVGTDDAIDDHEVVRMDGMVDRHGPEPPDLPRRSDPVPTLGVVEAAVGQQRTERRRPRGAVEVPGHEGTGASGSPIGVGGVLGPMEFGGSFIDRGQRMHAEDVEVAVADPQASTLGGGEAEVGDLGARC